METKPWYTSSSIWGSIIVVVSMAISAVGYTIDQETQTQIVNLIMSIVALAGSAIAIYGRIKATKQIK